MTNTTGRTFRIGETPRQILGYNRWVVIIAAWLAMGLASHFHWLAGFVFGASLGFLAMLTLVFLVRRPSEAEMEAAVRRSPDKEVVPARPAVV